MTRGPKDIDKETWKRMTYFTESIMFLVVFVILISFIILILK